MTKNAVGYARRSTTKQQSLPWQQDHIKEAAKRAGLNLIKIYVETRRAPDTPFPERVQGRAVIEAAQRGEFHVLIVIHRDRLSRDQDLVDTLLTLRLLKELGIEILFTHDAPLDTSDIGVWVEAFRGMLNSLEVKKTRERVTEAIRFKAKSGQYLPSRPPYGYRLRADEKGLEIVDEEAVIVRKIYLLCIGGMGKATIAKTLNMEEGPIGNRRWSADDIHKILHRPIYTGRQRVVVRDEEFSRPSDLIPPIISVETWEAAKASREARSPHKGQKQPDVPRLAAGLIVCGQCGLPLRARASFQRITRPDGTIVQYDKGTYHCSASTNGSLRCDAGGISCKRLDKMLVERVEAMMPDTLTGRDFEAIRELVRSSFRAVWHPAERRLAVEPLG